MTRSDEPRVGAFAACPFCGERAAYVRCLACNARGPLAINANSGADEQAASLWNGELTSQPIGGLFGENEGGTR